MLSARIEVVMNIKQWLVIVHYARGLKCIRNQRKSESMLSHPRGARIEA